MAVWRVEGRVMPLMWVLLGAGIFAGVMVWLYRMTWDGCDPFDEQCG